MASAPPSKSFASIGFNNISPLAQEKKELDQQRFEAWKQSPEGQKALADKARFEAQEARRVLDVLDEMGIADDDNRDTGSSSHKGRKLKSKEEKSKSTGFLKALAQKVKPKGK